MCTRAPNNNEMLKSRNFCFTSFREEPPDNTNARYIIFQREECPTTNRKHWQGTVVFTNPISIRSVGSRIGDPTAHIEFCQNLKASIEYCTKSETRIDGPYEYGDKPNIPKDKGWWTSQTEQQLWDTEPEWMLRHYSGVRAYRSITEPPPPERNTPEVHIYIGPPGTGKSWAARQLGTYYIKPSGKWWDGYQGQKVVIFDDFYGTEKYCDLLRWLSEVPIKVQIKGSTIWLLAEIFVFTSNQIPEKWYPNIPDISALNRRITLRREFNEVFDKNQLTN